MSGLEAHLVCKSGKLKKEVFLCIKKCIFIFFFYNDFLLLLQTPERRGCCTEAVHEQELALSVLGRKKELGDGYSSCQSTWSFTEGGGSCIEGVGE